MSKPTKNLWAETLPHTFYGAQFPASHTFDVVIIGGGFTGLSAALHIAQSGKSVCVVGAQTGKRLNAELADGPNLVFELIEKHQIQCSAVRNATLHSADDRAGLKDLKSRYAQQIARDAPVRLLDREETVKRTGSKKMLGSLWDPRAGTIQPLAYAKGLAFAAQNAGAIIVEHKPVRKLHRLEHEWIIETDDGTISADKVIQATNAYGTEGLPENQFIPVHYFQMATEPLSDDEKKVVLSEKEGCWDCATVMSTFRLNEEGRMLIGAVGNLDGMTGFIHRAWAKRKLASLFPSLSHLKFEFAWCGRIAYTSDHLPKVVTIGENAISIYGYSGRGISPGTTFGKCAANWAVGDNEDAFPIPITQPKVEGFKRVKSLFYESGAAATHLVRNWFG